MNKFLKKLLVKKNELVAVAALASAGMMSSAHAALDTSGVTAALTDAGAAVAVVGAAYLVVKVGQKAFKLVAGAL